MPCYSPLKGWKARSGGICFNRRESPTGALMEVPCGQCIGCRLEKSRQWALRIMHEASQHEASSFVTLTYAEDPVSLRLDDLQRFFKRVRKRGLPLRYYACGEYGERRSRPHFHVCWFGHDWREGSRPWTRELWVHPELEELWGYGNGVYPACRVGALTFESAAYVARYVTKKVTGPRAERHYERVSAETGEVFFCTPEMAVMSRRPGIGRSWYEQFGSEVRRDDSCIARGRECKPPRYYDGLYRAVDPEGFEKTKRRRKVAARRRACDSAPERLEVREAVCRARMSTRRRSYETSSDGNI